MSSLVLNGFDEAKSGDAPERDAVREGRVFCSSSSTELTKAKWSTVRRDWLRRKPRTMGQLLVMKVGPPATAEQSRDVNLSVQLSDRPLS